MFEAIGTLGILIAAGALFRWKAGAVVADQARRAIGAVVFSVFLPALVLKVLVETRLDESLWIVPLVAIVVTTACALVAWLIMRSIPSTTPAMLGSLILAAAFGNATYLGLPVVTAVVGSHVMHVPMYFDVFGLTPLLFTLGVVICVEYGSKGPRHTVQEGLRQAITTPPMIAALLGLAVNASGISLPDLVLSAIGSAASVVAPLMVFSVGLALRAPNPRTLVHITPALAIKLILAPVLGVLCTWWLTVDADVSRAIRLETAMPTMVLPLVFAERYGLDEEILAQAIVVSTLISLFILPLVAVW